MAIKPGTNTVNGLRKKKIIQRVRIAEIATKEARTKRRQCKRKLENDEQSGKAEK